MRTARRFFAALSTTHIIALALVTMIVTVMAGLSLAPHPAYAAMSAPAGLRAAAQTATSVTLRWSTVGSAPAYQVEFSATPTFTEPQYRQVTGSTGRISGLAWGTTHYFQVRVVTGAGAGLSAYSPALRVDPKTAPQRPEESPSAAPTATATPSASPSSTSTPTPTPTPTPTTLASAPLRIGSYNVRCASCYQGVPNEGTWEQRRDAIVSLVKSQDVDALGVQEASQGRLKDSAGNSLPYTQFEDLTTRLGAPWTLVNPARYNCVKATTPTNCVYQDQGASQGTKLLYNSARLELLDDGSKKLSDTDPDETHYMEWAILRQRNTDKLFIMSDMHTIPSDSNYDLRNTQAAEALAEIKAHNPEHLPMIAVGDWNSGRFDKPTNGPHDVYLRGGFVDPLGATAGTTTTAPGATVEHRIDTWLNSSNGDWLRTPPGHPTWVNGTYIDYIMTTPMRVSEWQTVVKLDSTGNYSGQIPSDHNMVRATVWLPPTS